MICRESGTTLADSVVQQLFYQVLKVCIAFLDYFEFINFCFYSGDNDDANSLDNGDINLIDVDVAAAADNQ